MENETQPNEKPRRGRGRPHGALGWRKKEALARVEREMSKPSSSKPQPSAAPAHDVQGDVRAATQLLASATTLIADAVKLLDKLPPRRW